VRNACLWMARNVDDAAAVKREVVGHGHDVLPRDDDRDTRRSPSCKAAGARRLQKRDQQKGAEHGDAERRKNPGVPSIRAGRGIEHARTVPAQPHEYKREFADAE
jgi:hypothetical protein